MRVGTALILCLALLSTACGERSDERRFTLNGQIETLDPPVKNLVVKHDEIKGFMPAMTMPYEVRDAKVLDGLAAGDLITATLVVETNGAYLTDIRKTGSAPLEKKPPEPAESVGLIGVRVVETGRAGPRQRLRRPGRQEAAVRQLQGDAGGADVHLHHVSAADVLPAHGSTFRGAAEAAQGRPGAGQRSSGHSQLRSGHRHAAGAQSAREEARAPTSRAGRS
jgi:protein SCO1/2